MNIEEKIEKYLDEKVSAYLKSITKDKKTLSNLEKLDRLLDKEITIGADNNPPRSLYLTSKSKNVSDKMVMTHITNSLKNSGFKIGKTEGKKVYFS